jgi:hypothetical protein
VGQVVDFWRQEESWQLFAKDGGSEHPTLKMNTALWKLEGAEFI